MDAAPDLTLLLVGFLLMIRLTVIAAMLPLISGRSVPVLWRLGLAAVVAAACAPAVAAETAAMPATLTWYALVREAVTGAMIGALTAFVVGIPFAAVRFAGQIIGVQIGFSMVNTVDPQGGAQVTVLAQLYYLLAVMLFFALDLHHLLIGVLVESCRLAPLFGSVDGRAGCWLVVAEFGDFFRAGLLAAAPTVIVLLLVSAAMGFVVKTVPQINILVVGFPIKIAVGLVMVGVSLAFFSQIVLGLFSGLEGQLSRLLTELRI